MRAGVPSRIVPNCASASCVFGFVIEDAVTARDFGRQHFFQFRRRVGPVGAELVEQGDVLGRHAGQVFQQPGDQAVIGRGARQVGEGDADAVAGLDPLAQRAGGDRVIQGGKDGARAHRAGRDGAWVR